MTAFKVRQAPNKNQNVNNKRLYFSPIVFNTESTEGFQSFWQKKFSTFLPVNSC